MLGDILATYASSWAIVRQTGHKYGLEIRGKPLLVFVLRKNTMTKQGSVQVRQVVGMLEQLAGSLIGPVEVWLAAGDTGGLDSTPIFPHQDALSERRPAICSIR